MFYFNTTFGNISTVQDFYQFYTSMRWMTGLILYPIVCTLGLSANILGVVILSTKQMRSSTSVLIMSLAVTDMVKIINDFLYFVTVLFIESDWGQNTFTSVYPYAHYVFNASMTCAAWLVVIVAVERYIFVCHPTKAKQVCRIKMAAIVSLVIAFVSLSISTPYALKYEDSHQYVVNETAHHNLTVSSLWQTINSFQIFNWFHYSIRSLIPTVLLIVLSCLIFRGLKKARLGKGKRRITICMLLVIVSFVVCVFPDTVLSTIFNTGYYEASYLAKGIREITDFLLLLNTLTNFVLYSIFNKNFFKTFKSLFKRCCHVKIKEMYTPDTTPLKRRIDVVCV